MICVSEKEKEILTIKYSRENDENILLSCCYRPFNGYSENLSAFLQIKTIEKSISEKKINYIIHFPKIQRSVLRKITIDLLHFRDVYDVILREKDFGRNTAYSCRTIVFI